MSLHHHYGVQNIFGRRYGYQGLVPEYGHEPLRLTPGDVTQINEMGGTILASSRVNPHDSAFCLLMGHNAVHAGMTGRTGMIVGYWSNLFTHLPISLAVSERKKIALRAGFGTLCLLSRVSRQV